MAVIGLFIMAITGFNVWGAALFPPLAGRFAARVIWLVPDRSGTPVKALEPQLLADSGTALDGHRAHGDGHHLAIGHALQAVLAAQVDGSPIKARKRKAH